ncbi:uncharacterized protein LOC117218763 isoform X2 [Megalopta genalis]|uniref:uncharacterized protein LOC117218763 isoform X2 n=1 Tax=Megalopta genalis TaxID=115081 RepID=UPI003FD23369
MYVESCVRRGSRKFLEFLALVSSLHVTSTKCIRHWNGYLSGDETDKKMATSKGLDRREKQFHNSDFAGICVFF